MRPNKIQCVECEHTWLGELDEEGLAPCPSCGKVGDLILYYENGLPLGVMRTHVPEELYVAFFDRVNEVYLRHLQGSVKK